MNAFFSTIAADFKVVFERDPAAKNPLEVLSYPGFHAILAHRFIHPLYRWGVPVLPRWLSQLVRFFTGIEIHPGARIGKGFFIDHGMGVVIGETCEIGENVLLYQGVTLGGTGKEQGKRHPTLGNNVVVGSGAKVLGSIKIEDGVRIGAGSVVTKPVGPNSTVVGVPGRVIACNGQRLDALDHQNLPDPVMHILGMMQDRIEKLEAALAKEQKQSPQPTMEGEGNCSLPA
ncbi:MAG: serine O-acetyltransferase [Bacteroidota bacterium]